MDKSKLKIDFINFSEYLDESLSYPMGILYISACLKMSGFTNIGYVDHICMLRKMKEKKEPGLSHTHQQNMNDLLKYLQKRQPHVILLGPITSVHLLELIDLVPTLREYFPKQLIVAGGPHFGKEESLDKELLEKCSGLDAITIGEAEETIVEVINLFYNNAPSHDKLQKILSNVKGLKTVSNIVSPRTPPILDKLPVPDWELLENYWKAPKIAMTYRYSITKRRNPTVRNSREIFVGDCDWGAFDEDISYFGEFESRNERFPFGVIVGSRGCPYKCNFCCSSGDRRLLAAKNIFEQIKYLNQKFGIRQFYFFDPLFTTFAEVEQKRIADLCKMISNSGLSIRYAIEIRADVVLEIPEDLLSLMINSGCVEFNLGLEKGSNKLLERTAKGMTVESHRDAVAKLRNVASKLGKEVLVNGTFILGGPGENQADIRDTLVHCISLNLDEVGLFPMEIHPGTQCYKRAIEKELIEPGLAPYLNVEYYPLYATEVLSASYLWKINKLGTAFFNALDELKGKMQELEIQFLPENKRNELAKYRTLQTERIQEIAKLSIGKILEYQSGCAEMEKEIESKENKLLKRYPDYDPNYGDYHVGDIQEAWDNCLTALEQVFQGSRKRTRVYGGKLNAY